jgi:predicted DNA-binding transcriptional regulator YafY
VEEFRVVADTGARLLRLLGLLQRRPTWSGAELAERLGVDARTVRRDVERLRLLGYEIDAQPGTAGGYRFGAGSHLPLLLDEDEATALAVVLGISAGAAVPGLGDGLPGEPAKLDPLLPPRLRTRLAALRASTVALVPPLEAVPAGHLVQLALACESHLRVTFAYRARDGGEAERRADPHRLVATERRWYLIAYDLDRADWRTFRVDRLSRLEVTGHRFEPRQLADPARLVAEAITAAGYRYRAVVRLAAPLEQVLRLVGPSVGVVDADAGGSLLTIGVDDFDWLAGYLVGLGVQFEAIEPPELRAHLAELGGRLAGAHRGGEPSR